MELANKNKLNQHPFYTHNKETLKQKRTIIFYGGRRTGRTYLQNLINDQKNRSQNGISFKFFK